jgi:hypothetical protein
VIYIQPPDVIFIAHQTYLSERLSRLTAQLRAQSKNLKQARILHT